MLSLKLSCKYRTPKYLTTLKSMATSPFKHFLCQGASGLGDLNSFITHLPEATVTTQ